MRFSTSSCLSMQSIWMCLLIVLMADQTQYTNRSLFVNGQTTDGNDADAACFDSSYDMLAVQIQDVHDVRNLTICPHTTIWIGTPSKADFSKFTNALEPDRDFPIIVVKDDMTIKCGEDGKSSNNCTLEGGNVQLMTTTTSMHQEGQLLTTNRLLVQGITFKSYIATVAFGEDVYHGTSVSLGAPGIDIVFDDCIFERLETHSVFTVGDSEYNERDEPLPALSTTVTIRNSIFRDIPYDQNIIENVAQRVNLENVRFEGSHGGEDAEGISSVIEVVDNARTDITDCVFRRLEVKSSLVFSRDSEVTFSGNLGTDIDIIDEDDRNSAEYCKEGLLIAEDLTDTEYECVELYTPSSAHITSTIVSFIASCTVSIALFSGCV